MATFSALAEKYYGSEITKAVTASLATTATLALKNRPQCLSLIFVGPSSSGKTVAVEASYDVDAEHFYRCDDFTPAAFVSHFASKSEDELEDVDLLPKIRNKVMGTKELSPIFNGDEKEMMTNFAVMTGVLDGEGHWSSKGTHGGRGYKGDYRFNWLGATTELPDRTYHLMGRLGNRLLFWEMGAQISTEEELIKFSQHFKGDNGIRRLRKAVKNCLKEFFNAHPVDSVNIADVRINKESHCIIVRLATLLAQARRVTRTERNFSFYKDEFLAAQAEGPHRIIIAFQLLLRGSASIHGRSEVTEADFAIIPHIAFSSIPDNRRKLLRLLTSTGALSRSEIESQLGWTKYFAEKFMKEFAATGVVSFIPGDPKTSTPSKLALANNFSWLLATGANLFQGGSVGPFVETEGTPPKKTRGVRTMKGRNKRAGCRRLPPGVFRGEKNKRTRMEIFPDPLEMAAAEAREFTRWEQ